jgi:hypothetical protein
MVLTSSGKIVISGTSKKIRPREENATHCLFIFSLGAYAISVPLWKCSEIPHFTQQMRRFWSEPATDGLF